MRTRVLLVGATLLCTGVLFLATAQAEDTDEQAMMTAYMEMMKPGPAHARLGELEGEWSYTMISFEDPENPMKFSGTSSKAMIMDGRYLEENISGEMMGIPFQGIGITGYNPVSEQYESIWYDSMGAGLTMSTGPYDPDEKVMVMTTEYTDPMTKVASDVKMVTTIVDENKHTFEWFMVGDDGEETKTMEIEYVRN